MLGIEREREISKGNDILTIPVFEKDYKVSLEVKATSFPNETWTNIIRFSTSNLVDEVILSVSMSSTGKFFITSEITGTVSSMPLYPRIQVGVWSSIQMNQTQNGPSYTNTITVDGEWKHTEKVHTPKAFTNVSCYTSSPWHPAQPGFIRKLFVYMKPGKK